VARRLTTNPQIDAYLQKVIADAQHHAQNVQHVIMPLSQAVRARINLAVDTVEVWQRSGKIGRSCWVTIGGNRYCFSYNYRAGVIDLRNNSTQGNIIFQFDNNTPSSAISQQAARL
jgi:hypothetical protein